jgi:hypothetical protein
MRYSGKLGIARQVEVSPGNWDEEITEQDVVGDMEQRSETLEQADNSALPRHSTSTSVSLLARGVGQIDNSDLRYLTHAGKRWSISSIVDQFPRIVLYFGGEYHGPTPDPAPDAA